MFTRHGLMLLSLLAACVQSPTVSLENERSVDRPDATVDARDASTVDVAPHPADARVSAPPDAAQTSVEDAAIASPDAAVTTAECARPLDCFASRGVQRCARGLVTWSCERGACVDHCDGPCASDCECPGGQCVGGECVSGPQDPTCPDCTQLDDRCESAPTCPYICLTEPLGFPDGQLSGACVTTSDCDLGMHCERRRLGSFCARTCTQDGDCRRDYRCVWLTESSPEKTCWPR